MRKSISSPDFKPMKRNQVFTPTSHPTVTYIGEHLTQNKLILQRALEMGGVVITISGPSKSGKTVFVETVVGKEKIIQITGAGITTSEALWKRLFDKFGEDIPLQKQNTSSVEISNGVDAKIKIPSFLELGGKIGDKSQESETYTSDTKPDYLNLIIEKFSNSGYIIFIDDFHYIKKDIQSEVSNLIKEAVRHGVVFVCASVPYHADDVVLANADLRGRMIKLDFSYWKNVTLAKIAQKGFEALNVEVDEKIIEAFTKEAAGSPQLMQALCLNFCFEKDIEATKKEKLRFDFKQSTIEKVCEATALMCDHNSVIESMKDGPKSRGEKRKSYLLKDMSELDVYPLILKAIAQDPPELTIRYGNLLTRINNLCYPGKTPSGSSITGACAHMAELANIEANTNCLEWDSESDVFDIRDPYLLFSIRWSDALR